MNHKIGKFYFLLRADKLPEDRTKITEEEFVRAAYYVGVTEVDDGAKVSLIIYNQFSGYGHRGIIDWERTLIFKNCALRFVPLLHDSPIRPKFDF